MAAAQFIACASATGDFAFWSSSGGTVTVDTSIKRTTSYGSWKMNTSSPAVDAFMKRSGVMADAGRRLTFWCYLPVVTPSVAGQMVYCQTAGATDVVYITLLTTGQLRISARGGTPATADSTATLAPATWTRVDLSFTITSSAVNEFRLYISGNLEASISNHAAQVTSIADVIFNTRSVYGTNFLVYFDEIYIDDGTDLADLGNIGVTAKRPAANNVNTWNTNIGANPANRWTNVNERPLSVVNGWSDNAVTPQRENYTLETPDVGDVDILVANYVARCAWVYAAVLVGVPVGVPQITANGLDFPTVLTTTPALYTVITTDGNYPDDPAGIGMVSAGSAVDATALYECGTLIAYKPAVRNINYQLIRPNF